MAGMWDGESLLIGGCFDGKLSEVCFYSLLCDECFVVVKA